MSSRHHTSHRTAIPTGSNPKAIIIIPLHVSVSETSPVLRHGGPHHCALIRQASAPGPRASEPSPPALIVRSRSIPATVYRTLRTACRSVGRVKTVTEAKVCGHSDNAPDHRIVRRSFNLHPVAGTAGPPPATPAGRRACKFNNHNDLRAVRMDTPPFARQSGVCQTGNGMPPVSAGDPAAGRQAERLRQCGNRPAFDAAQLIGVD